MIDENKELSYSAMIDTCVVPLTPDGSFKLHLVFEKDKKRRLLLFVLMTYKNLFFSQNYQEAKYISESIGLFGYGKRAFLDNEHFEVSQITPKDEKTRHTLLCKFIEDEKVYLNVGMCKTIHSLFNEALQGYSKVKLLENRTHEELHLYWAQIKNYRPLQIQVDKEMMTMMKSELPVPIKQAVLGRFYEEDSRMR